MNDGVTVCINVLRSVVDHLDSAGPRLTDSPLVGVIERLNPFAAQLGRHLEAMSTEQRLAFRRLRGVQGQTAGTRHAPDFIRQRMPEFEPDGLDEFLEREKSRTNDQAGTIIRDIETLLHNAVLDELRENFSIEGEECWYDGVPASVRSQVVQRMEEDKGKAGGKEAYLDLIHYRDVVTHNWPIFGPILGYGTSGDKQKKTAWIAHVNEIRKVAMHASRGAAVTFEQLSTLDEYRSWLKGRLVGEADNLGELVGRAADSAVGEERHAVEGQVEAHPP